MPEAAKNYSITELEMCGLAMNIVTFSHLLKKVDFDAVVDHLAITHIMRSKAGPATTRIERLIELLSPYSFNLYYIKGKDMVLSDFLSRQKTDDSNPIEIIPISFMLKSLVHDQFYQFHSMNEISETETNKYLIQTRSQAKSSGIKVPEIHVGNKGINPHIKPGRQRPLPTLPMHSITPTTLAQPIDNGPPRHPIPKPRIGQGRAGLKRKIIMQPIGPKIQHKLPPPYLNPYARPPPRPPDVTNSIDSQKDYLETDLDRKVEIEENSPFQEGIISETYKRPDKSYVHEPYELKDLIDTSKLVQRFLPKQMDIDKILDIIKRKVLKGTHLPLTIKEIQAGYLSSLYFKNLYLFLSQNRLPSK